MSEARIQRIRQVEKITEHQATVGQEAVASCQKQLDEQRARLTQLTDYLAEYAAGIGFAAGGRSQVFALQNYRAFMGKNRTNHRASTPSRGAIGAGFGRAAAGMGGTAQPASFGRKTARAGGANAPLRSRAACPARKRRACADALPQPARSSA